MAKITSNGIELEYDVFGPADGRPLLLVQGLSWQMTRWPEPLMNMFTDKGFRAIRFDNRDIGLSQKMDDLGMPDLGKAMANRGKGVATGAPYQLEDMAKDAVGLLDALGVKKAHIAGVSMGGMISQLVAADHQDRVLSLTSIMSTNGNLAVGQSTAEAAALTTQRPPNPAEDLDGYLDAAVKSARILGGTGYPIPDDELRARALADLKRSFYPVGIARQLTAIMSAPDRREKLAGLKVPAVVLHGDKDPLITPSGGEDTAASIPGAEFILKKGMGHEIPPQLYPTFVDAIMRAANRAEDA